MPINAKANGRAPIDPVSAAGIFRANLNPRHFSQQHLRPTCATRHHNLAKLVGRTHPRIRAHRQFAGIAFNAPARQFHIFASDRVFHILHGQATRCQSLTIKPDPHGKTTLTQDQYLRHTFNNRQPINNALTCDIRDIKRRKGFRIERDPKNGPTITIYLLYNRRISLFRQARQCTRHTIARIIGRTIHVARQAEFQRDLAAFIARLGLDGFDPFNPRDGTFQDFRDLIIHNGCRSTAIGGDNLDDRRVNLRVFPDRHFEQGGQAKDNQHQADHRRKDRPLDRGIGKDHGFRPAQLVGRVMVSMMRTGASGRKR